MTKYRLRQRSLSFSYSFSQVFFGLLVHPFQTMQMIVLDKYWLWMALMPGLILLAAFVIWQLVWLFLFQMFSFTPPQLYPLMGFMLKLIKWWFTYFCLIWQIVLFLLFVKFYFFYQKKLEKISHD